jgi:hypothetical protein
MKEGWGNKQKGEGERREHWRMERTEVHCIYMCTYVHIYKDSIMKPTTV